MVLTPQAIHGFSHVQLRFSVLGRGTTRFPEQRHCNGNCVLLSVDDLILGRFLGRRTNASTLGVPLTAFNRTGTVYGLATIITVAQSGVGRTFKVRTVSYNTNAVQQGPRTLNGHFTQRAVQPTVIFNLLISLRRRRRLSALRVISAHAALTHRDDLLGPDADVWHTIHSQRASQ